MKKILFFIFFTILCNSISAQKIVAISLEWADEGIDKCWSLPPYTFCYSPKDMNRVVILNEEEIAVIMSNLNKLEELKKYPSLDTRGRLMVFYENDFVECAYFGYLQLNYKFKAFNFSPSFILALNKIIKKYNKKGFWPSTCADYLRSQD